MVGLGRVLRWPFRCAAKLWNAIAKGVGDLRERLGDNGFWAVVGAVSTVAATLIAVVVGLFSTEVRQALGLAEKPPSNSSFVDSGAAGAFQPVTSDFEAEVDALLKADLPRPEGVPRPVDFYDLVAEYGRFEGEFVEVQVYVDGISETMGLSVALGTANEDAGSPLLWLDLSSHLDSGDLKQLMRDGEGSFVFRGTTHKVLMNKGLVVSGFSPAE